MLGVIQNVEANASGSPVCDVLDGYGNITAGHGSNTFNDNSGSYQLTADVDTYNPFEHVEITLDGAEFNGLLFTVVDEQGVKVGSFSPGNQVTGCGFDTMAVTHTSADTTTSETMFWIPPADSVGTVYVLGYVYDSNGSSFYRFVKSDNSALELTESDVIFLNGFE